MSQYKKESLDPVANCTIAQVDEYVSSQAVVLRNKLLENLCMMNNKFTLDPVAKCTIAQVDEYASSQAVVLSNKLLESLCTMNYKFTKEE